MKQATRIQNRTGRVYQNSNISLCRIRTQAPDVRTQYASRRFQQESLMLTGDLNASEVEWIAQFRVADPYKFLFKVDEERFL